VTFEEKLDRLADTATQLGDTVNQLGATVTRIGEKHEALAQSVELMHSISQAELRELRSEGKILNSALTTLTLNVDKLVTVTHDHAQRIARLESPH
jgi:hypothetical protein